MKPINQIVLFIGVLILASCCKDNDPVVVDTVATSAQFYKSSFSLAIGGREKIMLTLEPAGSELSDAQWSSSDTTIAIVNDQGIVTAIGAGNAEINVTAKNNISAKCSIEVIESPITGLIMPDANYPIAKDALVIIQCKGFSSDCKILLRPHSDFKSTKSYEDILVQIYDEQVAYFSFICSFNSGWYNVILAKEGIEYDLGNIEVTIPKLNPVVYDKTKIIWDDNHLRLLRLRGKVKKMTFIKHPPYTENATYVFNEKGFIESYVDKVYNMTYEYDQKNRIIKKIDKRNEISAGVVSDYETYEYLYGDHNYYLPIDINEIFIPINDEFIINRNMAHVTYDNEWLQKGLIEKTNTVHYISGKSKIINYKFDIASNNVNVCSSGLSDNFEVKYSWNFQNNFPVVQTEQFTSNTYSWKTKQEFADNGILIKYENENTFGYIETWNYLENCPYILLLIQFDNNTNKVGCKYEYDDNWNMTKFLTSNHSDKFDYTSYDSQGNWTQCYHSRLYNGITTIYKFTREITYW